MTLRNSVDVQLITCNCSNKYIYDQCCVDVYLIQKWIVINQRFSLIVSQ